MSKPKLTHYIPRFLTKPWEVRPGKLLFFDFDADNFQENDAQTMFAEEGLFTPEQEIFFNRYFETVLAQEINEISSAAQTGNIQISKYKIYRSIILFFHLQIHFFQRK